MKNYIEKKIKNSLSISHLYIHIPFCYKKCHYCDFYSVKYDKDLSNKYFYFFKNELNYFLDKYDLNNLKTIYFGGGNPLIDIDLFEKINNLLYSTIKLNSIIEYTIESNVSDINYETVKKIIQFKVNRVSVGIQSFLKKSLNNANREYYNLKFIKYVLRLLLKEKINVNLDFIIGLPFSKYKKELKILDKLLKEFNISHLSFYELTISKNSYWGKFKNFLKINEKNILKYEDKVQKILLKYNFNKYEISNYAKKGKKCKHNLGYWYYKDFIGLGPSAVSKIGNIKIENKPDLFNYFENDYKEVTTLNKKEILKEAILMNLRLTKGINIKKFYKRFGFNILNLIQENIYKYSNFFVITDYIYLNQKGLNILNKILIDIFIEIDKKVKD